MKKKTKGTSATLWYKVEVAYVPISTYQKYPVDCETYLNE